jgi:PBSX family phage terminase large subunit
MAGLDQLLGKLSRKQIQAIASVGQQKVTIFHGAVSSGKTFASLIAFLIAVPKAPHAGLIAICGRSLQTIERNILDPLMNPAVFGAFSSAVKHTTGSTTAVIFGRVVHLIGANDVRAEGRIRGATIGLAMVDELTLMPQSFFMMLLSRLRVPGERNILLATTNPDGPRHWARQDFILRGADAGVLSWAFKLDDNPALDQDYKDLLRRQYVGLWGKRFIDGLWTLAEGAVLDMWDEETHVVDELPLIVRWPGVGVDYGTTNPFDALLLGLGSDGALYLASEYRWDSRKERRQKTDGEYSADVRAWADGYVPPGTTYPGVIPERWVVDPSAASFITQLWRDGLSPTPADNSVLDGLRLMSSLLTRRVLKVHRSCRGFIEEAPSYVWDDKAAEKGEDRPVKVADHALDSARYVLQTTEWVWRHSLIEPKPDLQAA